MGYLLFQKHLGFTLQTLLCKLFRNVVSKGKGVFCLNHMTLRTGFLIKNTVEVQTVQLKTLQGSSTSPTVNNSSAFYH